MPGAHVCSFYCCYTFMSSFFYSGCADLPLVDAGCAVLSLDNYNDASRLIDGNFDGEFRPCVLSFLHVQ